MAHQFTGQFKDEEVLLVFRRHPIVMRKGLIILLIAILAGAIYGTFTSNNVTTTGEFFTKFFTPIGIGFALGMVALSYYWIGWYYSVCIVTNQRFLRMQQEGIFRSRSVNDINLHRILSVNYEVKGILENVLGFGTIIIQTLVGDFIIRNIPHPAKTQSDIVSAIKESGVILSEEVPDTV
jgi:uncharacterized membrane protein YdbT with pleckstrin-like domain